MPAATMKPAAAPAQGDQAVPTALVPFTRAAFEHTEQFLDVSQALSASTQPLGPIDVPAYGFARGIWVEATATGGTGVAAVAQPDAPFSVFDAIQLLDVNGAPIYGPLSGFETYLVDKYGGYFPPEVADAKRNTDHQAVQTSGNFSILLYIPLETNGRDALGALANLNGASTYKLRFDVAPTSRIYSTNPTGLPTLRIRAWLDAWSQPPQTDLRGNAQAITPPAHGTTSFWSKQVFNLAASGFQSLKHQRVGNYLRGLIFVYRDVSGVRNSTNFPAPLDIYWDSRLMKSYQPIVWRTRMGQKFGLTGTVDTAGALDTGVLVEDYIHEFTGSAGYELRDGWLPTVQSTRLEFNGTFGAAGTLTVITNDVSPAGDIFVG